MTTFKRWNKNKIFTVNRFAVDDGPYFITQKQPKLFGRMYLRYYLLMAVAVFLVATVVKYLILFFEHKRNMMKYVQHLPSPKEYPIIGSALRFFGKNSEGKYFFPDLNAVFIFRFEVCNQIRK